MKKLKRGLFHQGKKMEVVLLAPVYFQHIEPNGFLTKDMPCHALFHYFNTAMAAYKVDMEPKLEDTSNMGHVDTTGPNYHQLFLSVAKLYRVEPNDMERFWGAVSIQATVLGLTPAPDFVRNPKKCLN